jgi:hypothetical protein
MYTPGSNWLPGKPIMEQPLQEHVQYMLKLDMNGILVMGGPLVDNAGGLIVINADTIEVAQAVMFNDPAITKGICRGEAHPWYPLINKYTNENHITQGV